MSKELSTTQSPEKAISPEAWRSPQQTVWAVDVGSVSIAAVELDVLGNILQKAYCLHRGEIQSALYDLLEHFELSRMAYLACTGSASEILQASARYHAQVAYIKAAQHLHPDVGALLVVGGEKFFLAKFKEDGSYQSSRFNSLCAAGTGSFLDQQAVRLGLSGSQALAALAMQAPAELPKIASRCAVFAKTDLIHAQQAGYSLEAICGGLCQGLAANLVDVLFSGEEPTQRPLVFSGGVAQNQAVLNYLSKAIDRPLQVDALSPFYGALGSGLLLLQQLQNEETASVGLPKKVAAVRELFSQNDQQQKTFYPPLAAPLGEYPDFDAHPHYDYTPKQVAGALKVEVDQYQPLQGPVLLGLDVGSTSTKAVLLRADGRKVLSGFYTRTSGQPIRAVQAIFEAIWDSARRANHSLQIAAAGTTGSGRKFIGVTIGADLVVDEITAHARAATFLDPQVDTIIEIGGQDAKFTTLSHGTVTHSVMNHVCAAGTGSFIEEQAYRLNCSLDDMKKRTDGQRAPLASDRCTVFMERDLNHFLSAGYSVDEVLTAVLHAVRDNYLLKVARFGSIGEHLCFQGATAKNRSLVAAFEQKLQKPIRVSQYCHLTGALGVALILAEEFQQDSTFCGLELYSQNIPVRSEVCALCKNHCKLSVVSVLGKDVAFGFLCGRDYATKAYVSNRLGGFDLYRARQRYSFPATAPQEAPVVGLPAALYMFDQLPLWKKFFDLLGIRTVSSQGFRGAIAAGKTLAQAEFCAPMNAWHGHVVHLLQQADYVFTPVQLEAERPPGVRRQFCYYSQFASALVSTLPRADLRKQCLAPLVQPERPFLTKVQLYQALKSLFKKKRSFWEVSEAYEKAWVFYKQAQKELSQTFSQMQPEIAKNKELAVALLGRPYTVLSPAMNNSIPEIFHSLGVKTFFQDMLPLEPEKSVEELCCAVHWHYAASMIQAAAFAARTPGLYPVVLTSFKCAPDSCILEPLRRIMDEQGKPFLFLQLDDHDSRTGYETRIEAAVRAFQNHHRGVVKKPTRCLPINPTRAIHVREKALLVAHWDQYCSPLYVANLVREGFDARLLEETDLTIQKGLGHNTGQCVPLNAITQGFIDYVEQHDLDPEKTVLWMPSSKIACNIGMFGPVAQALLESYGRGFERAQVHLGDLANIDLSVRAAANAYFLSLFGGLLRRMSCHIRPYEVVVGQTNQAVKESLAIFTEVFLGKRPKFEAVKTVVEKFLAIPRQGSGRPKVAIFGDMYARDNDVFNQQLVAAIEQHGGEAVTTPFSDYAKMIAKAYFRKWLREGCYKDVLISQPLLAGLRLAEKRYVEQFERVLGTILEPKTRSMEEVLGRFGVRLENTGESLDNLLKVFHLVDRYPDLSLFVQVSPAFCCPSLVTEAMGSAIERETGVPVVSITYDGTPSFKNDLLVPHLELRKQESRRALNARRQTSSNL